MLYLFLLLPTLIFFIIPKRFPLYMAIVATMYMFYAYLWIDEHFFYVGKAGWKGFGMFFQTMFTAPFYFITHIGFIGLAWKEKEKKVIIVNCIGLALLFIHLIAMFN